MFSIGLLTVCIYKLNLYTGKIGYVIIEKKVYLLELLFSLVGNLIGSYLVGLLIRLTRFNDYIEKAKTISNIKLNDNIWSILILSMFCGMLMYIAVNNYKKQTSDIGKHIGIIMCVMAFILCGFEHCVANMFYFSAAGIINLKMFGYMIVMILGNSIGSIVISFYDNFVNK